MSTNLKAILFGLLAYGVFAGHDVVVKVLGGTYSPIQIVFFSALFSFPMATLMLMSDAKPGTLLPIHPVWMIVRTAAAVTTGVCAFYAFSVLPLAQTYAILFATPLFITLLSIPILGETIRFRRTVAVLVGLAGVMVVLRPGAVELSWGHLAAIVAAATGALTAIIVRKIGREERTVVLLLYPMLGNVLAMGAALPFVYVPMPIEHMGMLALISVLAWTAGRLIISAYALGDPAVVAPMQYSQIIWASFYGWVFFDQTIDHTTALGAGIIIASGLYIVLRETRASTVTPVLRTRSRPETGTSFRVGPILRARGLIARRPTAEPK